MIEGAPGPLVGKRILIVEDRYLIASEMAAEVSRLAGEVLGPARDLASATHILESHPVDIALLDVNLDGAAVFPLAETLEARGVPIVFLTGYDAEVMPQRWRGHQRLTKPLNPKALREALVNLRAPAP